MDWKDKPNGPGIYLYQCDPDGDVWMVEVWPDGVPGPATSWGLKDYSLEALAEGVGQPGFVKWCGPIERPGHHD